MTLRFAQSLFVLLVGIVSCSAQHLSPEDVNRLPSSTPTLTASYGSSALQIGDLRIPVGKGPFPVVVVVHGGCWMSGVATRQNTAALATWLTSQGYATWNIEYRHVGDDGGGWPGTFLDWGAATDYVRTLAKTQPLDVNRVAVAGHSAGAEAAAFLISRTNLPASSEVRGANPLHLRAAVLLDGPPSLPGASGSNDMCGQDVVHELMGGGPSQAAQHYREIDPLLHGPLPPQLVITAHFLPEQDADDYKTKATAKGWTVEVLKARSGHFEIIAPGSAVWKQQIEAPLLAFLKRYE